MQHAIADDTCMSTAEGAVSVQHRRRLGSPKLLAVTPPKRIISEAEMAVIAAPERGPGEWVVEPSAAFTSRSYTNAGPEKGGAVSTLSILLEHMCKTALACAALRAIARLIHEHMLSFLLIQPS
jgi:hypothetical protein